MEKKNEALSVGVLTASDDTHSTFADNTMDRGWTARDGNESGDGDGLTVAQIRRKRLVRVLVHTVIGVVITGWWIAGLVLHHTDKNWIVPFLVWLAIILRLVSWHVSTARLTSPISRLWGRFAAHRPTLAVPPAWSFIAAAVLLVGLVAIAAFSTPDSADNNTLNRGISLVGIALTIGLLWATSKDRSKVCWHSVIVGLYLQFLVALFVLRTNVGYNIFAFLSSLASDLLGFSDDGLAFLTDASVPELSWFVISVVPPIIFFSGLAQLLSYWGALQWLAGKGARFFRWALKVSGAEAIVATTSPFFGQGESVMLIKPFLAHLTMAELHQVMCSGFATIAGSVLVAFIALGVSGTALVSSCVMSIPASIVVSKIRYPETEETITQEKLNLTTVDAAKEDAANWIHAFTHGCWLGMKLAGIVIAVLGSVYGLVELCDGVLTWAGSYLNIESLTLELILGYALVPVAFFLGVPRDHDLLLVSRLIAVKILRNEFSAYEELQISKAYMGLSLRSRLIATYSVCGFGNIGAVGTQVGLMAQMAPGRSKDIASVAMSAFVTGVISTLTSASMAGLLLSGEAARAMLPSPTVSPMPAPSST